MTLPAWVWKHVVASLPLLVDEDKAKRTYILNRRYLPIKESIDILDPTYPLNNARHYSYIILKWCVMCVLWYCKHVAWSTTYCFTSTTMFKVNNSTQQDSFYEQYSSPCSCFLQPKLWLLCYLRETDAFSTCVTPGISRYTHPEGEPCTY